MTSSISLGYETERVEDIKSSLVDILNEGFAFASVPLYNDKFLQNTQLPRRDQNTLFCDMELSYEEWGTRIVGKVSSEYLKMLDNMDNHQFLQVTNVVEKEMIYGSHLAVAVIHIELIDNIDVLASLCSKILPNLPSRTELWMNLKVSQSTREQAWNKWVNFISLCNYKKSIKLSLEFDPQYKDIYSTDDFSFWEGENVAAVVLPTRIFKTNNKGFPILHLPLKTFVNNIMMQKGRVIIKGDNYHFSLRNYAMYMKYMHTNLPAPTLYQKYGENYEDQLQVPLQPLADNLDSGTYDVFEKDPIKYKLYKNAIYKCLLDKHEEIKKSGNVIVIMVLGAGRGPLVKMARDACIDFGCNYEIFALEKNINAIITLDWRARVEWTNVTIVCEDMRKWVPPSKADILVSELLGSFGDNELSPECLDCVESLLKDDGVSIPSSYTSYIVPISAEKVYSELVNHNDTFKSTIDPFQVPYVVNLSVFKRLANVEPCFTFEHGINSEPLCFTQFKQITFDLKSKPCVIHGFAGYFSCVLYDDIEQSIHPETHSPDMFSWFPMYFPLKTPIIVKNGEPISLGIWRINDTKKVWYEWSVSAPSDSILHNSAGLHYHIDL